MGGRNFRISLLRSMSTVSVPGVIRLTSKCSIQAATTSFALRFAQRNRFRCANLKAKDVVAAWIEHLLVNLITPGTETVLIDRSSEIRKFRPPTSATQTQTLIKELLATYWRGLTVPLPFFAESSSAYARSMLGQNGGDTQTALRAAARAWSGNAYAGVAGEADDPWNALVFSGFSPLDADFAKLALDIFRPLTEHLDGKLP